MCIKFYRKFHLLNIWLVYQWRRYVFVIFEVFNRRGSIPRQRRNWRKTHVIESRTNFIINNIIWGMCCALCENEIIIHCVTKLRIVRRQLCSSQCSSRIHPAWLGCGKHSSARHDARINAMTAIARPWGRWGAHCTHRAPLWAQIGTFASYLSAVWTKLSSGLSGIALRIAKSVRSGDLERFIGYKGN